MSKLRGEIAGKATKNDNMFLINLGVNKKRKRKLKYIEIEKQVDLVILDHDPNFEKQQTDLVSKRTF